MGSLGPRRKGKSTSAYLENSFAESGALGELFEIFGIWALIVIKVRLENSQLVVLERSARALRA